MDLAKGIDGIGDAIFYNDHMWIFCVIFFFSSFSFLNLIFFILLIN